MNDWSRSKFSNEGVTHETFRKGSGPVVIIVHEIPGITPAVEKFANEVVAAGFTVVMPLLVGNFGESPSGKYMANSATKVCISREFTTMALNKTSPIISWLRALAKYLHAEVGGKGVGAVGMCFSGGFALGIMVDDIMLAPVLSQPSLPFALGAKRSADLNLSPQDAHRVAQRAAAGCQVLGLRYTGDRLVGTRFAELHKLLGDAFIAVEFESTAKSDHSVLTEQRQELGVQRVLEFLKSKLL
ncbi:MAG: dienelactone hydrolase [Acidimicrobium sp.]|nr:MAG: dienelactone hydrolase [Acidimicrobium sp.]